MSSVAIQGNASGAGVFTIAAPNSASSYTATLPTNTGTILTTASTIPSFTNKLLQVQVLQTGTAASGTTQIPYDNTIPQITEGTEFMTVTITPTSASSILEIRYQAYCSHSSSNYLTGAIFRDSTANALVAGAAYINGGDGTFLLIGQYRLTAGSTSSTTFRFRMGQGNAGGTTYFNAVSAVSPSGMFGGVEGSYLAVYEYAP
jgi:hypothetical protein